ncbi:TPA: PhoH family protein [Campylobacter coli]|nr:PhoH family protein [Campylobacter coli]
MKTYVVDTNIILDDVNNLSRLYDNENRIIIPETVIDELDSKKSLFDEVGYQARNFARLLSNLDVIELNKFNDYTETTLGDSTLKVTITSKKEYKHLNDPANILNDRKIIEVAKLYPDCIFITYDSMCKIRAISEGIKTETFGLKKDFNEAPEFFKVLDVEEIPENLSNILSIDPDYKHENYNYLIQSKDGNKKLARIQNLRINYIDEKHLEKQDVKPINIRQKYFVDAMLDTNVDLQVVSAVSGSGKSLLAIATGIRLVKEKQYSKIVYIRNSIESLDKGEDIGYLAGNDEKFAVFNHPLYDSLEYIVRKRLEKSNDNKSKKTKIDNLKIQEGIKEIIELSGIETMWIGALRGRTISDAFVIVDESQNFSSKSMSVVLTRIDKDCKVVIIGSNTQIDNQYINKYNNALTVLQNAVKNPSIINTWGGELINVVRGPITEFAEQIFNKDSIQKPETMKSFVDSSVGVPELNTNTEDSETKLDSAS